MPARNRADRGSSSTSLLSSASTAKTIGVGVEFVSQPRCGLERNSFPSHNPNPHLCDLIIGRDE